MDIKTNDLKRLKKIPIEFLWDGLALSDAVYNSDGTVLLIPSGETISEKKLSHLYNFLDENHYITVSSASYDFIMREKEHSFAEMQRHLEDSSGYTDLKLNVGHMLKMIQVTAKIEHREARIITDNVLSILSSHETTEIFQCIDVPRPMDEALLRHSLNVALLNGSMGQWLALSQEQIRHLVLTGLLHDVGKTKIPDEILNAPRKLTPEEFEIVKMHPVYSYELLGDSIEEPIRQAVRQHHEKLDGSGYPDALCEDKITLLARITAVSDIYDAMVSARSYKTAHIPFDVLERFSGGELGALDPVISLFFVKRMMRQYKNQQVILSDGTLGKVAYIPPNDISHPIIVQNDTAKQVDDSWYCARLV